MEEIGAESPTQRTTAVQSLCAWIAGRLEGPPTMALLEPALMASTPPNRKRRGSL